MSELRLNKSMGWYARTAVRTDGKKGAQVAGMNLL